MPNTSSLAGIYSPSITISESSEIRPAINDNWQARRELADALRCLNTVVLTTDVPIEDLLKTTAIVQEAVRFVESYTRVFGRKAQSEHYASGANLFYEMSPATGQSNAVAPKMHIWREGVRAHARVTLGWSHEGQPGYVHDGVVAMLFDQLLGVTQGLAGSIGHTGTLTIRHHHLTPLNKTLNLISEVKCVDGRKKIITGELWVGDVLTASSEGLFITKNTPLPPVSTVPD